MSNENTGVVPPYILEAIQKHNESGDTSANVYVDKEVGSIYRHIDNSGVSYSINKTCDGVEDPATFCLKVEMNSFGVEMKSTLPLDAEVAKWLIKTLTEALPELEAANQIEW